MRRSLTWLALPAALFLITALAVRMQAAPAAARQAPETVPPGTSCTSEGCHQDLVSRPTVHAPAAQKNGCGVCHQQTGDKHAFTMPISGADLCTTCHPNVENDKTVHGALKLGAQACTACHDPHSSANEHLLKAAPVSTLCLQCHSEMGQGTRLHELADMGGCTVCHEPHAADDAKLLKAPQPELCATCHGAVVGDLKKAASVHGPAAVSCTACHNPHLALSGKGLKSSAPDLCISCHTDFKPALETMQKVHPEPLQKDSCLLCHSPHSAPQKHLLKDTSEALCLGCHKDELKLPAGGTLPGLGPQLADGAHAHGPLTAHDCAACHDPHGNAQARFLRGPYPAGIYADWTPDAYGFCFTCHDESLVTAAKTTTATQFRNGDVNLHYVHVDRARKGRSCRICHEPHASKNEHLLRTSLPFGQWELPIGFKATPDGGSCAPGCHLPKTYSRGPAPGAGG
jgi:predicted CXXCH cytochrome family protein